MLARTSGRGRTAARFQRLSSRGAPARRPPSRAAGISSPSEVQDKACIGSAERAPRPVPASSAPAILRGMMTVRSACLFCAAIVFGILASPAAAQQAAYDQPIPAAQQTGPSQPLPSTASPPAGSQTCPDGSVVPADATCPAPPPFPPMPSRPPRHRFVDVGHHAASHATHHRATHARHRTTQAHHRAAGRRHEVTVHASKRTIRACHKLTYRQILRDRRCRALMRQDIASHEQARRHHAVKHRRAVTHRHRSRHRRY